MSNDALADLRAIIQSNTPPDCDLTVSQMVGQTLLVALDALKTCEVYEAHFDLGQVVLFTKG